MSKLITSPLYSLADISIIPSVTSTIKSRSECDPFQDSIGEGDTRFLPLISAPMSCIYQGGDEWKELVEEKINPVIPRTFDLQDRLEFSKTLMTAFSLSETYDILEKGDTERKWYICIDMANGHMEEQIETGRKLREKFGDSLVLMGGNIANPLTYLKYDKAGFDYVRCGIGGGNSCFVAGTQVTMSSGETKSIEDVNIGDIVKTKSGNFKVLEKGRKKSNSFITINDKVTCTEDHKFFVINKKDKQLDRSGYYVEAKDLNKDLHLLVKYRTTIELEEITSISTYKTDTPEDVYDLEIESEHSYIANGYVVHNCLTSTQTAIHTPMASLLSGINEIRRNSRTKVVADGGISGYSDIIKCLALGADYVMMGRIFTKAAFSGQEVGQEVPYYGMSTKKAQKEMGGKGNKTAEGRETKVIKEYTLSGWAENFRDYLRSAMSYTDSRNLYEFSQESICNVISPNSSYSINNK